MMLTLYFVVALTVGQVTALLRSQRLTEQQREERARALFLLARELADSADLTDMLGKAIQRIGRVFEAEVTVMLPGDKRKGLSPHKSSTWLTAGSEQEASLEAFERNQAVEIPRGGKGEIDGLLLPLSTGGTPTGVLGLRFKPRARLTPAQRTLLDSFVQQTALVLDRHILREATANSRLLAESERLSRTLLNSVSHELRTPLSVITTAVQTLGCSSPLTPAQQTLARELESAAARLNRVVDSLLSAARLQSGQLRPKLVWCDIPDLVRCALRNMNHWLVGHPVRNDLSPGLPLVKADFVLLEQAVGNLLHNAAVHTSPGTRVEISAHMADGHLVLEIADNGPGLPEEELQRIFELFYRVHNAQSGGTGLGLAIVKGFVEAQGGTVRATNRPDGGAVFAISLPAKDVPKLPLKTA
jgi:two-component system sensor histidine kinase KdpD